MKPALSLPVFIDSLLQRLEIRQKISVRQDHSARLRRRPRRVKNFRDRASRRSITRIDFRIGRRLRSRSDVFQVVDNQRGRCSGKLNLLPIAQNKFYSSILDRALNKVGRCRCIHRHGDGAAQQNPPKAGHPFGRVRSPQ